MRSQGWWVAVVAGWAVAVSGGLAGCGSGPQPPPRTVAEAAPSPSPSPSIAVADAPPAGQLADFVTANNAANAARDDQALRAVESGTSLVLDLAGYAVARGTDPSGARSGPGFDLVGPRWWVTPAGRWPRWSLVRARGRSQASGTLSAPRYLAFAQREPGAGWLLEYGVDVDAGTAAGLPEPALTAAGAVTPCSPEQDPRALSRLVASWFGQLVPAGAATGAGVLADQVAERLLAQHRGRLAQESAALAAVAGGELHLPRLAADELARRPEPGPSVRLRDGGCLVLFASQEWRRYRAATADGLTVAGAYRALAGVSPGGVPAGVAETVSVQVVDQWLAVLGPSGDPRPGRLLGHAGGPVAVEVNSTGRR